MYQLATTYPTCTFVADRRVGSCCLTTDRRHAEVFESLERLSVKDLHTLEGVAVYLLGFW